jgi:hypothetical protein
MTPTTTKLRNDGHSGRVSPEDIKTFARELAWQLQAMIERLEQQAVDLPTMHTPEQASEILGVTVETLCRWRLAGKGPRFVKEGKFVRYPQESLREFITGKSEGGAS